MLVLFIIVLLVYFKLEQVTSGMLRCFSHANMFVGRNTGRFSQETSSCPSPSPGHDRGQPDLAEKRGREDEAKMLRLNRHTRTRCSYVLVALRVQCQNAISRVRATALHWSIKGPLFAPTPSMFNIRTSHIPVAQYTSQSAYLQSQPVV